MSMLFTIPEMLYHMLLFIIKVSLQLVAGEARLDITAPASSSSSPSPILFVFSKKIDY
jgi:hypothetical protein